MLTLKKNTMSEAAYKRRVKAKFQAEGWLMINLIQTNMNGIADSLLLKKGHEPFFIEFKARGEKPDPLQDYRHREILEKTGVETKIFTEP